MRHVPKLKYEVRRIKLLEYHDRTNFILHECNTGLFVATLEDVYGESTHTVGINLDMRKIYDCMELVVHNLSLKSLFHCCGDKEFKSFKEICKLCLQDRKKGKTIH